MTMDQKVAIAERIISVAQENNLQFHPGQDPSSWAELVIEKGGCPCVRGRSECPCDHVMEDIKEINRCRCGLFVNEAYLVEYEALRAKSKGRGKRKRRPE